jgi:hypothetical protein
LTGLLLVAVVEAVVVDPAPLFLVAAVVVALLLEVVCLKDQEVQVLLQNLHLQ